MYICISIYITKLTKQSNPDRVTDFIYFLSETSSRTPTLQKVSFICFNENSLKMMNNVFSFILKVFYVLKIITLFFDNFAYVEKWLDKKADVDFKIYDVTNWNTSS